MENNSREIKLDTIYKITKVILAAYFLYLLTVITIQNGNSSEVGRYQIYDDGTGVVLDTRTGELLNRWPTPPKEVTW